MNLEVFPHDFCKLQPPKLYKNVRNFFMQKVEKLQRVIFGLMLELADAMLRQLCIQASRPSPAQKYVGRFEGGIVIPKTFPGIHFLFFGGLI